MLMLGRLLSLLAALGITGCVADGQYVEANATGTLTSSLVCEPLNVASLVREEVIYQVKSPAALKVDLLFSADRKSAYVSGFRNDCHLLIQSTENPLEQVRNAPQLQSLIPDGPPQSPLLPEAEKYLGEQFQQCERNTDEFLSDRLGNRDENQSGYDFVFGSVDEPVCYRMILLRSPTILLKAGAGVVVVDFADAEPFVGFF